MCACVRLQLSNINEDPQKDGAVLYALREGEVNVGRPDSDVPMQIKLVTARTHTHARAHTHSRSLKQQLVHAPSLAIPR